MMISSSLASRRWLPKWRSRSRAGVFIFVLSFLSIGGGYCASAEDLSVDAVTDEQRSRQVLIEALSDQGQWSSIHAAEYLLSLGIREPVLAAFRPQKDVDSPEYRIGVWRVLANAESRPKSQQEFIERIRSVLLEGAADQLHAIESLAKLGAPIRGEVEHAIVANVAKDETAPGRSFAIWRLLQETSPSQSRDALFEELRSTNSIQRLRAAFTLSQLGDLSELEIRRLRGLLKQEEPESIVVPYLAMAIGVPELRELLHSKDSGWRGIAIREMARRNMEIDFDLRPLLTEDSPIALRLAAAFALMSHQH